MIRNSLRLRLLGGGAVAVFVALALAWTGLSWLFQRHVERREVAALVRLAERIVADLQVDAKGRPIVDPGPSEPRLSALAGGLYWQVTTTSGTAQSASLWDQSLASVRGDATAWSAATMSGPFRHRLLTVSRRVRPDARSGTVLVQVAEDDDELRSAVSEFRFELAAALGLLWLVLSLAAYWQVRLGLHPLDRLRRELDRLRRSPAARLSEDHPVEIAPLAQAINALAQAREDDLGRARRRAADLAHSLKTPLAVLAAQSRRARAVGADVAADGLDRAIHAVGAALETELARSRAAAARTAAEEQDCLPSSIIERLVKVIERTERGEAMVFDVSARDDLRAPLAATDLAEMLGALIENAARHARRMVRIAAEPISGGIAITVEDDGPGMDEARTVLAMQRGRRLDEAGTGHGLGLAIVRDLAEATEARLRLERSPMGGLRAQLSWDRHSPA